ncbi:EamA family transporter [Paenibacillus sp. GCM10023252]|uniref:EamA family transporter n=1 Tax=Paenibacillus sp. GCM10023252 TaxID=3252649 RepID=UPI003620B664
MWLTYSLLAAVVFGLRGILYHWTSQQRINRNLLLCGAFFIGAVIGLAATILTGQPWHANALIGIQMGLFSFGANASMFKGFAVGKVSIVAILTALPAVFVVAAAFVLWGEQPTLLQGLAFLVILGGVLLVRYSNDITWSNMQGAGWAMLATVLFACNDLSGKYSTIINGPLFPTLFFMFLTGAVCFGGWYVYDRRHHSEVVHNWSVRRTFLTGMGVGTTNVLGMVLLLNAFELGTTGLVSAVAASSVIVVLLYTRFAIKEPFTVPETAGIITAFVGILMMRLFGH